MHRAPSRLGQLVALFAFTALAVEGCGGSTVSSSHAEPAPTATVTATVTAEPSVPSQAAPARLGKVVSGNGVAVTVLKVDPSVPVSPGIKDQKRWASVLAKTCATRGSLPNGKPLAVSWAAWQVADADGGTYNITDWTGGIQYQLPTYPTDPQRLSRGQCVKGWITFNVAPGVKIARVIYGNGGSTPIYWSAG